MQKIIIMTSPSSTTSLLGGPVSSMDIASLISASSEFVMRYRNSEALRRSTVARRRTLASARLFGGETPSSSSIDVTHRLSMRPTAETDHHYEFNLKKKGGLHAAESKSSSLSKSLNRFGAGAGPSSWEHWWISSPQWRRKLVTTIVVLAIFTLIQFVAGVYFFLSWSQIEVRDPMVCATPKCRALSKWMSSSADYVEVNPCSNFYKFTCGKHNPNDKGDLWEWWFKNFARLESDGTNGESILAKILLRPEPGDVIGQRVISYYQTCMKIWQTETLQLNESLTILIQHIFDQDFDLWGTENKYELERVAVKMIRLFGDDGFYHVYAPVAYPKVIFATWIFTGQIKKEYLTKFLPLIYDALNIRGLKVRDKLDFLVGRMVAKLEALMFHGLPNYVDKEGKTCLDLPTSDSFMAKTGKNNDYNFELPYFLAYHGEENVDMESPTPKLTNGKVLKLTPDPLKGAAMADNYRALISNWNCWVADTFGEEEDAKYVRPFYATFWSLRLLIELVHEADAKTAEEYELGDKANRFFSVYQEEYHLRTKESRCFQSTLDSMGYYPVFHYFRSVDSRKEEALKVIRHAALELLKQFRPPEEGGLSYISPRHRNRMYRLLVDKDATNIIVPTVEDDPTFVQSPLHPSLAIGNTHVRNIIAWRQFTFNRTLHFWRQGSPQGKLVWYKAFYQVDHINVYEAPSTTSVSLIRFPPSIFIHPFWNNDLEIANFAGGRILAAKAWMTALTFDFADYNVEQSIISHRSKGAAYWEGVSTLSSYKRCLAVTYNWFHPKERDVSELAGVALTSFDPHFLALRYGFHKTGTFDHIDNDRVEAGTGIWPTSLPVKTMLRAYFRQVRDVRENPGDDFFTPKIRKKLRYSKLIGFEAFSEAQLFFLINFREICRSRDDESDFYKGHVIENLSGFMQMEEFANVWHCPPNGGMNPPKPCFKENWKTGKSE